MKKNIFTKLLDYGTIKGEYTGDIRKDDLRRNANALIRTFKILLLLIGFIVFVIISAPFINNEDYTQVFYNFLSMLLYVLFIFMAPGLYYDLSKLIKKLEKYLKR